MPSSTLSRSWIVAAIVLIAVAAVIITWMRIRSEIQRHEQLIEQQANQRAMVTEDLLQMMEADQITRALVLGNVADDQPATPERRQWLVDESYRLNHVHAERLRRHVWTLGGWPTVSRVGADASIAACVIAVHHHTDTEFMAWSRDQMEPHVADRDVDPDCWARLVDRVLLAEGKPQRYGTQMRDGETDGVYYWGIDTLEDPEGLLERRAAIGLMDYAQYLADQRQVYRVPPSIMSFPDEPHIPGLARHDPVAAPPAPGITDEQRQLLAPPGGSESP